MIEVRRYLTASGKDVIGEWLESLNDARARARINVRFARLTVGNFGDCKRLREGVHELRIDYGPGYRVYFTRIGDSVVLLLCGGDKRGQLRDIERAITFRKDFARRNK
jgi:putative addiction module killer protein